MRTILHYLASMIIIPLYGVHVCPFLESLNPAQVALPIIVVLALQYAIRFPLITTLVTSQPMKRQSTLAFRLEMTLFIVSALILTAYNSILYDFPVVSGMKVLVGISALGFFAAIDLALERERNIARMAAESCKYMDIDDDYFSLTTKVSWFASITVTLIIGVFMLLINKDLAWLQDVGDSISFDEARLSIIKEFSFALIVILPHTLNIIFSYSKNLRRFFDAENDVLKNVTIGELSVSVPISSNDEFGIMAKHTNIMVEHIRHHTEEIKKTRDTTILTLASLAETRDNETGAHILRTQRYVKVLAEHLKDHPRFSGFLNDETIDLLYKSAPLHDIGKVGIADAILLKPGKLTADEFEIMKTHSEIGSDALKIAEAQLGSNDFLRIAREISLSHHEKWDGSGYPGGLSGDDIPISGRLMAVADVYDALISKRVYKPAFPHAKAMKIIFEGRGLHFDADIIDALAACEEDFKKIARVYHNKAYTNPEAA